MKLQINYFLVDPRVFSPSRSVSLLSVFPPREKLVKGCKFREASGKNLTCLDLVLCLFEELETGGHVDNE